MKKKLVIIVLLFLNITYSQTDKLNLFDHPKFDSVLKIKKVVDKKKFKKTYYSIQLFSGQFEIGDSISKLVSEKFIEDSVYFYFETPNYKVRLGKYKSKLDAEKKLKILRKEFKSAFIFIPDN
ncbi:MAG: SPOR domain-containing protein [Flavobacteriaceae bacterium]|nr:SPOR domain-containing protein [Flavobacteriaceae bacterium]MBL6684971.1 SPOR domain-containing protein [Flavobacteriaceae bacterium]